MPHSHLPHHRPPLPTDSDNTGDNYYISLSDLMVGMLFIFLILLTYFALQSKKSQEDKASNEVDRNTLVQASQENEKLQTRLHQLEERLTNTDRLRAELLERIQKELTIRGVAVEIDEARGVLRLPQDMLFDAGSATLKPHGTEALHQLADVLHIVVGDHSLSDRLESVYIEGHTDNSPIRTSQFRDNLSLSAARAMNTYQTLIQFVPEIQGLANTQNQALFGISGYGDLRPIGDNNTEEGKVHNRRIDFRFVMSAPQVQPPTIISQ